MRSTLFRMVASVVFVAVLMTCGSPAAFGQAGPRAGEPGINPELLNGLWSARWIYPAGESPSVFGVYHFRKQFTLSERPDRFVVHVSADNRYQLFVNGHRAAWGPARGSLFQWRYETVDLSPWLHAGNNQLAAVVWNFAQYAPEAQVTNRTAFLLQGDDGPERVVDTDASWKCLKDPAYKPIPFTHAQMRGYFVAGPGEDVDAGRYPWGWEEPEFDDRGWPSAVTDERSHGSPRMIRDAGNRWMLIPRTIPPMAESPQRFKEVRSAAGVKIPSGFPEEAVALTVPPHTRATILLDQGVLTTGYPELEVSGGRGGSLTMGYAEALYNPGARRGDKGNRNEIDGKEFVGYYDRLEFEGGQNRLFRPLWWRTWRYVELRIETGADPLTVNDLRSVHTGYPFERNGIFRSESGFVDQLLEVGWRTARLCAHESYMDCPYYEQLQYVGDTRIQALISYFNSGDGRLARNAIAQLDASRVPDGVTMSRAPTRQQQFITPFSLWWIGMVHDYWMYQDDPDFVRSCLPGVRAVLEFFTERLKPENSLGPLPWWSFVDWVTEWPSGEPPAGSAGSSSPLDLQLLLAAQWSADLEASLGSAARAEESRSLARSLTDSIPRLYWSSDRKLFADTPAKNTFSQHANALAVIAGVIKGSDARELVLRMLDDKTLAQASYYFRYYLNRAVIQVGEGDRYLKLLGDWQTMLDSGLTTWAERPEGAGNPARSDCHAWSAHPNIEIFRTVLGVDSAAPGFEKVVIRPFPGELRKLSGRVPHPGGEVSVQLDIDGDRLTGEVMLPAGIEGTFEWMGQTKALPAGRSTVRF